MAVVEAIVKGRRSGADVARCRRRIRVLLIEGMDARAALGELLDLLDYDVVDVADGTEALAVNEPPDVIVAGATLPDGSAADVVENLREQPGWEDVPAIVLGHLQESEAHPTDAFVAHLEKPLLIYDLDRALKQAANSEN